MADERMAQIEARYEAATNEVPPGWQYEDFHNNAFPDIAYLLAGLAELAEYAEGLAHDLGVVYEACTAAVQRAERAEAEVDRLRTCCARADALQEFLHEEEMDRFVAWREAKKTE